MPRQKSKDEDKEQSKRFIEAAREAESDETEEGADRGFKKVVPPKDANNQGGRGRKG